MGAKWLRPLDLGEPDMDMLVANALRRAPENSMLCLTLNYCKSHLPAPFQLAVYPQMAYKLSAPSGAKAKQLTSQTSSKLRQPQGHSAFMYRDVLDTPICRNPWSTTSPLPSNKKTPHVHLSALLVVPRKILGVWKVRF